MTDDASLDMIAELEDALLDMVTQHCLIREHMQDINNLRYHHGFLSANEGAFDVLERYGLIEPEGKVWKVVQKPTKNSC